MASTWSQGQWNFGSWNNSASGAVIDGLQASIALGNITVDAELRSGWGRGTYSSATWNEAPDSYILVSSAGELTTDLNLGFGWSREEYSSGPWNFSLGYVLTGNGNIFSTTTTTALTTSANNITVIGNSPIAILGEELTISQGEENIVAYANVVTTGEELTATVNAFAVQAGGSITINTPTFEANVELNNDGIVVGLASFLNITGQSLTIDLANVTPISENIIPITGEQANVTVNTITLSTDQILTVTGNVVNISLANIVPNSENFISIDGNQANVSLATLKFWDPILPTNTEIWTNIH